jgi:regulator of replication initiation timing
MAKKVNNANQINEAILQELQTLRQKITELEKENAMLKQQKNTSINEDIIKMAIKRAEEALKIKIKKYIYKDKSIAILTEEGFISLGTINPIQKRIYLKSKFNKEDIQLMNELTK